MGFGGSVTYKGVDSCSAISWVILQTTTISNGREVRYGGRRVCPYLSRFVCAVYAEFPHALHGHRSRWEFPRACLPNASITRSYAAARNMHICSQYREACLMEDRRSRFTRYRPWHKGCFSAIRSSFCFTIQSWSFVDKDAV